MIFSQTKVNKLRPPAGKSDHIEWDDAMPGFGIRFRNGGAGIYMIQYSLEGRNGRMTLGSVAQVKLDAAQTEARKAFALIAQKLDPQTERAKAVTSREVRFIDKVDAYCAHLEKRGRSVKYIEDHRRMLGSLEVKNEDGSLRFPGYLKELHRHGLGEITRAMVSDALDAIEEENGFRQAGLARSYLHGYYSWQMTKGLRFNNGGDGHPVMFTEKRNSVRRTRILSPEEIVAIWNATDGEDHFDKIVRLLLLTATRKTQIGSLARSEFNARDRLLDFIPAHVRIEHGGQGGDEGKTKNRERFWLPLSDAAFAIIDSMPLRNSSDYIFGQGEGGFSGWSACKARLDAKLGAKVPNWTFHDFRRTFESLGIDKAKIAPWVTDVCLHHVGEHKKGVKRVYNHADYIDEKRKAMTAWAEYVTGLVTPALKAAA